VQCPAVHSPLCSSSSCSLGCSLACCCWRAVLHLAAAPARFWRENCAGAKVHWGLQQHRRGWVAAGVAQAAAVLQGAPVGTCHCSVQGGLPSTACSCQQQALSGPPDVVNKPGKLAYIGLLHVCLSACLPVCVSSCLRVVGPITATSTCHAACCCV
jgi:hypothetical protein